MPGVRQESGPGDQFHAQEESTRHGGGDDVEIQAAHGSGDSGSVKDGWKHVWRSGQLEWPGFKKGPQVKPGFLRTRMSPIRRVPSEQVWKVQGLEWSETPGDRKLREGTTSTTRNDADFDVQVTDANMSSSDDPSSGLSSTASVCWQGEKHVRRDQVVDAFRSDCVDIERGARDFISVAGNRYCPQGIA